MSAPQTQRQRVLEKLGRDGFVSNLWAINRGIWRLGAVVHGIRHARHAQPLEGHFGAALGLAPRHRKNFFYCQPSCWAHVGGEKLSSRLHPETAARMNTDR